MDTSQEGSRKRHRGESEASAIRNDAAGNNVDDGPIVHDEEYYEDNGDCVILVGRVLFKIHRFLLERDASALANMFSVPQGDTTALATDDHPLILYDDVDDFRSLCWILYARPAVCVQQHSICTADLQKLVLLYLISQKYHFECHKKFARDLLYKHCNSIEADVHGVLKNISFFRTCTQSRLQSLVRISHLEKDATMEDSFSCVLRSIWISRLKETKETTSFAFDVAEGLGLRPFLSQLYYLHVTWMNWERIEGSVAYTHTVDDLSPERKVTLYRGYFSLQCYWSETRKNALEKRFDCVSWGRTPHICDQLWRQLWGQTRSIQLTNFDPLLDMKKIECIILGKYEEDQISCAADTIAELVMEFESAQDEHFLGLLPKFV